mmetsp:Transcript_85749/g.188279  ORF Transcript_85749/g.188279 Transcript_85749/m.188279 type:complete len:159 (+) Transcript_85749:94-570(+)
MAGFLQKEQAALQDADGNDFDIGSLKDSDVIALYFSAHWCPPCRGFTPVLKQFYEKLQAEGQTDLKVVFVSSDRSEKDMWSYMKESHGKWLTAKFGGSAHSSLGETFGIRGIPCLMVLDQAGNPCVSSGVQDVYAAMKANTHKELLATWRQKSGAKAA